MKAPRPRRTAKKPPPSLDDLFASRRSEESFLAAAKTHVVNKNSADTSRRQDIIHPSEVAKADWCPRATYLRISTGVYHKEKFSFQSLNIFDHGHEVHRKWQNRAWEMNWLEGTFKCLNCGEVRWAKSPDICDVCRSSALEYAEVPLRAITTHQISGHADGLLAPISKILEVKTVGEGTYRFEHPKLLTAHSRKDADGAPYVDVKKLWANTTVPFPSHLRQVQIYIWLANQIPGVEVDGAEFIYESKMHQAVKSFTVKTNFDLVADRIHTCREIKLRLIKKDRPPACPKGGCKDCNAYEESDGAATRRRGTAAGTADRAAPAAQRTAPSSAPRRGSSGTAGGPDRPQRRRPDGSLRPDDELGRVRRNTARSSRSRREAG
ncbi:hypothetical protein AB0B15_03405 [Streptomyces sp. NPDC045456]|uniref:hypothetical protein n=1 Tax=Streptomyces sp. NPDC045456 TaxID=3155254 RepID=UPI0033D3B631